MSNFNPITASLEKGNTNPDTHNTPEYRSAFFKRLLGKELTDSENRAFEAAQAESVIVAIPFSNLSTVFSVSISDTSSGSIGV